jgi:superfamily II DNA or RNA helicase
MASIETTGTVQPNKRAHLCKYHNALIISPLDVKLLEILEAKLTYVERKMHMGWAARNRESPVELITHRLYELPPSKTSCVTHYGLWQDVYEALKKEGYVLTFQDQTEYRSELLVPDWNGVADMQFRPGQREFLEAIAKNVYGRFDCATGFGKSFMIEAIAKLYPRARIDVVSKSVPVIRDRVYRSLIDTIGDVGMVGGGKNITDRRVMCYSLDSAHKAPADADILIGDECHQLSTERSFGILSRWSKSRNYGLSGSMDMRWDNNDIRARALFGPVVYGRSFSESVEAGNVTPITVKWVKVAMNYNPASGHEGIEKKRHGIWQNTYRNQKIAETVRHYDADTQVLICTDTLDHAIRLKALLPEYTLVYSPGSLSHAKKEKYVRLGLIREDEPCNDRERHAHLTEAFERGDLKKVIATTIWNVGVSFDALSVLFRAGGGASDIGSVQIPGRVSRIYDGKEQGILHDCDDFFDAGLLRNSRQRYAAYQKLGFQQEKERDSVFAQARSPKQP